MRLFDTDVDIFDLRDRVTFLISSKVSGRLNLSEAGAYVRHTARPASTLRAVK
jgi:hypothetical protein